MLNVETQREHQLWLSYLWFAMSDVLAYSKLHFPHSSMCWYDLLSACEGLKKVSCTLSFKLTSSPSSSTSSSHRKHSRSKRHQLSLLSFNMFSSIFLFNFDDLWFRWFEWSLIISDKCMPLCSKQQSHQSRKIFS